MIVTQHSDRESKLCLHNFSVLHFFNSSKRSQNRTCALICIPRCLYMHEKSLCTTHHYDLPCKYVMDSRHPTSTGFVQPTVQEINLWVNTLAFQGRIALTKTNNTKPNDSLYPDLHTVLHLRLHPPPFYVLSVFISLAPAQPTVFILPYLSTHSIVHAIPVIVTRRSAVVMGLKICEYKFHYPDVARTSFVFYDFYLQTPWLIWQSQ